MGNFITYRLSCKVFFIYLDRDPTQLENWKGLDKSVNCFSILRVRSRVILSHLLSKSPVAEYKPLAIKTLVSEDKK